MSNPIIGAFFVATRLVICVDSTRCQTVDKAAAQQGILAKVYSGAVESLAWYDIPIVAIDLAQIAFVPSNPTSKLFRYPPTNFDKDFQTRVGVRGSQTIVGRVDEEGAAAFLGTRLLVNLGADLLGGNVTSEDYRRTFWFYKSIVYTYSLNLLAKKTVYRMRPDGSDNQSFFSGHSSTAFCTASYFSLELNDWYDRWETTRTNDALRSMLKIGSGIALYAGATYVAYARMHDEKHYLSDVVVGAVVGTIVGTSMSHWHWSNKNRSNKDISFLVVNKTPTVSFTVIFNRSVQLLIPEE